MCIGYTTCTSNSLPRQVLKPILCLLLLLHPFYFSRHVSAYRAQRNLQDRNWLLVIFYDRSRMRKKLYTSWIPNGTGIEKTGCGHFRFRTRQFPKRTVISTFDFYAYLAIKSSNQYDDLQQRFISLSLCHYYDLTKDKKPGTRPGAGSSSGMRSNLQDRLNFSRSFSSTVKELLITSFYELNASINLKNHVVVACLSRGLVKTSGKISPISGSPRSLLAPPLRLTENRHQQSLLADTGRQLSSFLFFLPPLPHLCLTWRLLHLPRIPPWELIPPRARHPSAQRLLNRLDHQKIRLLQVIRRKTTRNSSGNCEKLWR